MQGGDSHTRCWGSWGGRPFPPPDPPFLPHPPSSLSPVPPAPPLPAPDSRYRVESRAGLPLGRNIGSGYPPLGGYVTLSCFGGFCYFTLSCFLGFVTFVASAYPALGGFVTSRYPARSRNSRANGSVCFVLRHSKLILNSVTGCYS